MDIPRQINKTLIIIDKPLKIGAEDLLRGVEYTYCGDLHLLYREIYKNKWKHRYCIISRGCLYIYSDKTSKKTKTAYSLKDFDSVQALKPQEGERFCIQLIFKNAKTPLLFSCDTNTRREEWVKHFCSTIEYVKSQTYMSADSGFGSAGTVPEHIGRPEQMEEAYEYVNDSYPDVLSQHENASKENLRYSGKSDNDIHYKNPPTTFKESKGKQIHVKTRGKGIQVSDGKETIKDMTKVKELKGSSHAEKTQPMKKPLPAGVMDELKSRFEEKCYSRAYEETSIPALSEASYLSVRGAAMSTISGDTDQEQEGLYVNRDSSDSGDSTPEIVYENTEPEKFRKKDYFCTEKKQMKKELVRLPEGTFAVCPRDSSELELSLQTESGLKCFPIYSQNGMVSLFQSHQRDTFPTLDILLCYYVLNPLPSPKYSVRLVRGYKS